jgi:uncharacterized protein with PIN domain
MARCPLCKHEYWQSTRKRGVVDINLNGCQTYVDVCPNCSDEYYFLSKVEW